MNIYMFILIYEYLYVYTYIQRTPDTNFTLYTKYLFVC